MYSLGELAQQLGLSFSGDTQRQLTGLASLTVAGPEDVSFLSDRKLLSELAGTRAGVVILAPEFVVDSPVDCLIAPDPYLAFARVTALFDNRPLPASGVHASAVVSARADVAGDVSIGPQACVEAGAVIGSGAVIGAGCFVGADCHVGEGSRLYPGATLYHDVHIGVGCTVHANAVIGADGFGFAPGPDGWEKFVQLGGVRIGNGVEIGANTTIDRGALEHTVLEDGVIIDNLVQIAHNCRIGKNTAIAGCTGLAGSTIIGQNCTLAGGVGVTGHLEICNNVHVTAMSTVTRSITTPGAFSSALPARPSADFRRSAARFAQLDAIQKRLVALEKNKQS